MDPRTQERVERWDSRPFTGGYNELSSLAENGFSGVVTASGAWLFMLNGRIVGIVDGEIETFEHASGEIYAAPHASLPLLCSMQAQGGETRANYYTNETPLSEVDQTLQEGSFTGYIELSEQVLSGDYYAVYYGGRRMAAAYIGNAQRRLTGEEAFERAADEVGIYEVVDVEIDVTDVPESNDAGGATPQSSAGEETRRADDTASDHHPTERIEQEESAAETDPAATAAVDESNPSDANAVDRSNPDEWTDSSGESAAEESTRPASAGELRETADLTTLEDDSGATGSDSAEGANNHRSREEATEPASTEAPVADPSDTPEQRDGADASSTSDEPVDDSPHTAQSEDRPEDGTGRSSSQQEVGSDVEEGDPEDDAQLDARLEQEERWRETRSIPSIDPEKSQGVRSVQPDSEQPPAESPAEPGTEQPQERSQPRSSRDSPSRATESVDSPTESTAGTSEPAAGPAESATSNEGAPAGPGQGDASATGASATSATTADDQTVEHQSTTRSGSQSSSVTGSSPETGRDMTDSDAGEYEQRIETLTQHARELESERDRLHEQNRELSSTVDRLESRIDELEAECERLRAAETVGSGGAGFGGSNDGRQLSPHEALSGTNLFVRYGSKSDSTLQTAHDGAGDEESVSSNLQIEQHTTFDSSAVTVTGQAYEEFLTETIEYKFVDWLVETLLFEIRETGHGDNLGDLYDAIPRIDRAELHASISLEDDDTEEVPEEVTFDVVAFDKMGNPLVVANLNDSRDPATEGMLAELEEAASAVTANYPDLGAAMVVTSSYFEPGALEVTEEATSSGFLSRGSKLSYVNLSRKQGYHLSLVESRSGGFHMTVPEL